MHVTVISTFVVRLGQKVSRLLLSNWADKKSQNKAVLPSTKANYAPHQKVLSVYFTEPESMKEVLKSC